MEKKVYSELIVNSIINKIISLTFTRSFKIKIDNQIPDKCFNYVKDTINNALSTFFIFYDKDEDRNIKEKELFKSDIEEIKEDAVKNINQIELKNSENNLVLKNYFFNNEYSEENNWDLIEEPISTKLDRYATTLIKFQEKNAGIESKYKINHEKILEEEELENSKTKNDIHKTQSKMTKSKKDLFKYTINNLQEENKKLKMTEIMHQLKTVDLEPEENYESKQIMKLRRIFEKNKEEREKEKEKLISRKKKDKMKQQLVIDNFRKYVGKKINTDHNGQIIFIKSIKADSLKKDFIFSNSKCKAINNTITKPKSIEKNKEIKIEVNKEEEKEDRRNRETKYNKFKRLKLLTNKHVDLKNLSPKKNVPLITSGSNFYLMNMEVGVSLKEDEKFKTGGLDFFNKYKKYSVQVYDKKLKEAENSNKLIKNIEIQNEPKTQTLEEMNNLYKTNYTLGNSTYDGYSSSILNTDTNMYNKKGVNNIMNSTNTNNSSIFKNYTKQANMTLTKSKNNLNSTPIINMKSGVSSLLNSFDKLNLISKEENSFIKKNRNIFRQKLSRQAKQNLLEDINNFTKNLITNKKDEKFSEKIANSTGKIKGMLHPDKPSMREIIQEIGLKGKLSRERKKFLPVIKSNFLDNENFFKQ